MTKQPSKPQNKFPSISRIITDYRFIPIVICSLLLLCIFVVSIRVYSDILDQRKVVQQKDQLVKEVEYWKNITKEYPNYRDAYFTVAVLEYQLGNIQQAQEYLRYTMELDPNFEAGKRFEIIVNQK